MNNIIKLVKKNPEKNIPAAAISNPKVPVKIPKNPNMKKSNRNTVT